MFSDLPLKLPPPKVTSVLSRSTSTLPLRELDVDAAVLERRAQGTRPLSPVPGTGQWLGGWHPTAVAPWEGTSPCPSVDSPAPARCCPRRRVTPPRGPSPLGRVTLPSPGSGPQRLPAPEPRWDKTRPPVQEPRTSGVISPGPHGVAGRQRQRQLRERCVRL